MRLVTQNIYIMEGIAGGNAYALAVDGGLVLIDSGMPSAASRIKAQLTTNGYGPGDLQAILLTHAHFDHAGAAAELAAWSGARVLAHHSEVPYVEGTETLPYESSLQRRVMRMAEVLVNGSTHCQVAALLDDGDVLTALGGLHVVHTPGHTPGSICFYHPAEHVLFTGDLLVSSRRLSLEPALHFSYPQFSVDPEAAERSAMKLLELPVEVLCCGHGTPVTTRAGELIRELVFRREASAFAQAREFLFKHDLLREVTYESVLKRVRQAHHALVADWLIANAGDRIGEYVGLIGEHLARGGREEEAGGYLLRAAEAALGAYSSREAERFCRRALALVPPGTPFDGQRAALLQGLGRALQTQNRRDEAVCVLREGIDLYRALGDLDGLAATAYELSAALWRIEFQDASVAWPMCREVVEELAAAPASPGLARLLGEAGRTAWFAHQPYETIAAYCRRSMEMAKHLGLVEVELDGLITLGLADPVADEAVRALEQAAAQAEQHGLSEVAARACLDLAVMLEELRGDYGAALPYRRKSFELARRTGDVPMALMSLSWLVMHYGHVGKLQEVPALLSASLSSMHVPEERARAVQLEAESTLRIFRGDFAQALASARLGVAHARNRKDLAAVVWHNFWIEAACLARTELYGPDGLSEAEEAVRESLEIVESDPLLGVRALFTLKLARIEALLARSDVARRLLAEGERLLSQMKLSGLDSRGLHQAHELTDDTRFYLARAEGAWDAALALARSRIDRCQKGGARWQEARWLLQVGDCLHARGGSGDQEQARQVYRQSLSLFTDMGADGYVRAVEGRLASVSGEQR